MKTTQRDEQIHVDVGLPDTNFRFLSNFPGGHDVVVLAILGKILPQRHAQNIIRVMKSIPLFGIF